MSKSKKRPNGPSAASGVDPREALGSEKPLEEVVVMATSEKWDRNKSASHRQRRPDDPIEAVCDALLFALSNALCLHILAGKGRDNTEVARMEWFGCEGDGEIDPETKKFRPPEWRGSSDVGLRTKWEILCGMDTKGWEDLCHWQILKKTIEIIEDSRPDLGWRAAWLKISGRLRELRPDACLSEVEKDLRERADHLRAAPARARLADEERPPGVVKESEQDVLLTMLNLKALSSRTGCTVKRIVQVMLPGANTSSYKRAFSNLNKKGFITRSNKGPGCMFWLTSKGDQEAQELRQQAAK